VERDRGVCGVDGGSRAVGRAGWKERGTAMFLHQWTHNSVELGLRLQHELGEQVDEEERLLDMKTGWRG
jgi:hypothetical protein